MSVVSWNKISLVVGVVLLFGFLVSLDIRTNRNAKLSRVMGQLNNIEKNIIRMEDLELSFLSTEDVGELDLYETLAVGLPGDLQILHKGFISNQMDTAPLDNLGRLVNIRIMEMTTSLSIYQEDGQYNAIEQVKLNHRKHTMQLCLVQIAQIRRIIFL